MKKLHVDFVIDTKKIVKEAGTKSKKMAKQIETVINEFFPEGNLSDVEKERITKMVWKIIKLLAKIFVRKAVKKNLKIKIIK